MSEFISGYFTYSLAVVAIIVIFGGGSGLSQLLKGIKQFPIDITAVVTVCDNGRSTGLLRKEMHIPAVGDITKVMLSMADTNQDVIDLMNHCKKVVKEQFGIQIEEEWKIL